MPAQGRIFIESYPDATARLEPKFDRNYRFITNPKREEMFMKRAAQQLFDQIMRNIQEREARGVC